MVLEQIDICIQKKNKLKSSPTFHHPKKNHNSKIMNKAVIVVFSRVPVSLPMLPGWPHRTATQPPPVSPPPVKEPSPAGAPLEAPWARGYSRS